MHEPVFLPEGAPAVPFSAASEAWLRAVIDGTSKAVHRCGDGRAPDVDFRRRYAALILQERGG